MVVLGLATSHREEYCRYVFTPILSGLRWPGQTVMGSWPPALFKKGEEGRKKKEVLHLSRCYTHIYVCISIYLQYLSIYSIYLSTVSIYLQYLSI